VLLVTAEFGGFQISGAFHVRDLSVSPSLVSSVARLVDGATRVAAAIAC
jgi:hypothetical protein